MSLRDAAQQALEALRIAQDDCIHGEMAEPSPIFQKAITALETALAEPQPEPVAWRVRRDDGQYELYFVKAMAKRAAECYIKPPQVEPLYTAPPQRQPLPETLKLGCRVCGIGADGKAYGYVCSRSDCPTRITCGGDK